MKTTRVSNEKEEEAVLSPSGVLGSPQLSPTTGACLQETRREAASALEVSPTDGGRRNAPRLPSPHLITSHQHLELTTPGEEPADTGRGKGRGRPRQAEPGREGRETFAKDQHARAATLAFLSCSTETITRSDRSPSSLVSLIRKMKFRRVQKNRPWGLRAEIFWHPN